MIFYHGSDHDIEWPDYASIVEHSSDAIEHSRGLHVSTSIEDARAFGERIYEIMVDDTASISLDPDILQQPRHQLFMLGCAVVLDEHAGHGVIIDLDAIDQFERV